MPQLSASAPPALAAFVLDCVVRATCGTGTPLAKSVAARTSWSQDRTHAPTRHSNSPDGGLASGRGGPARLPVDGGLGDLRAQSGASAELPPPARAADGGARAGRGQPNPSEPPLFPRSCPPAVHRTHAHPGKTTCLQHPQQAREQAHRRKAPTRHPPAPPPNLGHLRLTRPSRRRRPPSARPGSQSSGSSTSWSLSGSCAGSES